MYVKDQIKSDLRLRQLGSWIISLKISKTTICWVFRSTYPMHLLQKQLGTVPAEVFWQNRVSLPLRRG